MTTWGDVYKRQPYNIPERIQEITLTLQGSQPVRASTPVPVAEESVVSAVDSSYREIEPVHAGLGAASYHKLPNPLAHIIQQLPVVDLSLIHI